MYIWHFSGIRMFFFLKIQVNKKISITYHLWFCINPAKNTPELNLFMWKKSKKCDMCKSLTFTVHTYQKYLHVHVYILMQNLWICKIYKTCLNMCV